ncbi:uncharacterized protein FOBCDRAFT_221421 [Fusarium oxysporum Fo47]|uniref:uncharacterized protein n=1 Tax=Fusarium oxysporum Fo47 TaxID=660027 RepID=UPI002869A118|nr:uncharacterized protein FOBCDRAFT_221421 [Fusarium oxysporum Fo47]QKD53177.2 hypothetical protein FOBCDRAFT_221421 [Fusarium oxysporum Fo47]
MICVPGVPSVAGIICVTFSLASANLVLGSMTVKSSLLSLGVKVSASGLLEAGVVMPLTESSVVGTADTEAGPVGTGGGVSMSTVPGSPGEPGG